MKHKKLTLGLFIASSAIMGIGQAHDEHATLKNTAEKSTMITSGVNANITAEQITLDCQTALTTAKAAFKSIENDKSVATLSSVISAQDKMLNDLLSMQYVYHFKAVHPDASVRETAQTCGQDISDFFSTMSLSSGFYQRVAAIDLSKADKTEQHMIAAMLRDFKKSGVDKDQATREKVRSLKQEISKIGNEFDNNIRQDVKYVETTVADLAGLPEDYIAAHAPDENGVIKISTDYPDAQPIMKYAQNDDLRYRLRVASRSRGYPKNEVILKNLLKKRHELAQLLGYKNHAQYVMDERMIGDPETAQSFLARVGSALKAPTKQEQAELLKRLQKIEPNADKVQVWQAGYLSNMIKQEDYALDAKEVREYFQYDNVRDGIFTLTEDLFGVQIRPWKTSTWHDEVESYEVLENGQLIGRFYMDNHPRTDKYKHAAHWTLRTGIKDKQIPLSGLACNFPDGLMEHGQVETFLHEFGHLIHNMFSGTQKWLNVAGMSMERDFVEAPSQMLEEWVWDYETLKTFAKNKQGETIPASLVEKMNRARSFGESIATSTQIFYANLSLNFYNKDPDSFELLPLTKELQKQYAPYDFVEGTSFYTNFGHLNGYSANYYTYQWSLAISTDMFSKFKQAGMRNKDVANAYRNQILGSAGSRSANEMLEEFLGRKFTPDAYIEKLKNKS